MKGKITLLAGAAIGYVLGTRAGRERYEQIKSQAQNAWNNPKVQEKAAQAQDFAKEKAPEVQQKLQDKVQDTVHKSDGGSGSAPSSTAPSVDTPTATSATAATQTTAPPAS